MSQVLRSIAATLAIAGVALLGPAVRADATPSVRGQAIIEYDATNAAAGRSATANTAKDFKGVVDDDSLLDKIGGYFKNPVVLILAVGTVLVLAAWKVALH